MLVAADRQLLCLACCLVLQMLYMYNLQPLVASLAVTCLILPLSQVRRGAAEGSVHGVCTVCAPSLPYSFQHLYTG
jgi:hypothetical protein